MNKSMFRVLTKVTDSRKNQRGFSLVESLVAVAIFGTVAYMLVFSLFTGMTGVGIYREKVTVGNIARTQMEYSKSPNQAFYGVYVPDPTLEIPDGYSVGVTAENVTQGTSMANDLIKKIVVTVYKEEESLYRLEGFKLNE
jgi:prepilin-type N-terminal cleavage/methylation domain-containing protein